MNFIGTRFVRGNTLRPLRTLCKWLLYGFHIPFDFNEPLIRQRKVSDFRSLNQLSLKDLTIKGKPTDTYYIDY